MAKKPASLTGDLLARKGEARPSDLKPVNDQGPQGADISILPGRQPHLEGVGVKGRVSTTLPPKMPEGSGVAEEMTHEEEGERPSPPEPEIIYTPEDNEDGSRTKLIAGAFVGVALVGGVLLALMLNDGDRGIAPVSQQAAQEANGAAPIETEAPAVAVESAPAETTPTMPQPQAEAETAPLRTAAPEETVEPQATVTQETSDPALAAAAPEMKAAEEAIEAKTPTPELEPAMPQTVAAEAEEPAPMAQAKPALATGGNWVVQLLASRSEADAEAAWEAISGKHAAILGGHGVDIQKADLGDKGTFYRVRAAGFETKAEAAKACSALKSAGQDCLIRQR